MKRLNRKSVVLAAGLLLIGGGAYLNYLQAQRAAESQMSDLTLANLEAMAWDLDDSDNPDMDLDGELPIVLPCNSPGVLCVFKCKPANGSVGTEADCQVGGLRNI